MPFKKGGPAGPGRPKGSIRGAERFKAFMEDEGGIDKLFALADSEKEAVQLEALKFIADRAYGKAPQALKHSGLNGSQPMITGDFLIALAARINAQRIAP